MKKLKNTYKGFTLIELLVVIAIIGLLATMSIIALNNARSKSRDARRLADMRQLIAAMEMYYNEYGDYPAITSRDYSNDGSFIHELVSTGIITEDLDDPGIYNYHYDGPSNPLFEGRCPGGKSLLLFFLENNMDLNGFAKVSGTQNSTNGYGRHICFY